MAETEKRTLSDKFMLRLPDGMRDRIKAAAEANNRSMNAEIIMAIELWLNIGPESGPPLPPVDDLEPPTDYVGPDDLREIIDSAVRDALAIYEQERTKK